jgi:endonuclease/exonuclease/phosphatase family metal-dependent hydrolase
MPQLTICSFNVEWMNDWFTLDAEQPDFRDTFQSNGHESDTAETAGRAAAVIRAIDPDVLAIQEGPSRSTELDLFVNEFLSDDGAPRYRFFLGDTGGQQKLGLLYKPDVVSAELAPATELAVLINPWMSDVDGDGFLDEYAFTRTPLVVRAQADGQPLELIVLHTKSNFVNNGSALWENLATRQQYVIAALRARRRNSAEGMRLRRYLDDRLQFDPDAAIVVLGDMNDGPGLDYFEENYLTHNVTDILLGSAFEPETVFAHAQHDVTRDNRYTAVFDDFVTAEPNRRLLLDHILLSPGLGSGAGALRAVAGSGAVRHAEWEAQVVQGGDLREHRPSDHRPVTVELEY